MKRRLSIFVILPAFILSCAIKQSQEQPPGLVASFSYVPTSPMSGQPVQFTDTSTGNPTSWEWSFGEGTLSTLRNPSHTYTTAGSYQVSLTVRAGLDSDSAGHSITIMQEAVGHYVDVNNPAASDSNPGTEALPWKTINIANQTLIAGDTVYIKAGNYSNYIAPVNSGTASGRITYMAYGSDVVTIRDTTAAITLNGKSYISVQGINFYNCDRFAYLLNGASHNIISYCNFDEARNRSSWAGSAIYGNSSYNVIQHCRFSKYGEVISSDDRGCVLDIGSEENASDSTSHNLIEDSEFSQGGHHVFGVFSMYNVIRNNYFHNEEWMTGTGDRGFTTYGGRVLYFAGYASNSGRNLFEGNKVGYSADPPDDVGASGMTLVEPYNIIRFNCFYHNDRAGLAMGLTSSYVADIVYNKIYNNSFFHNGINPDPDHTNCGIGLYIYSGTHIIKYNTIRNNVLYKHPVTYGTYGTASLADQIFAGNWDGDSQGNPQFVNASEILGNPMDSSMPDLRISSTSPCRDAGTYLTTISSPSGSGTTLVVADAGYFTDGWGIDGVEADEIQIVGTFQKARITHVDYGTNTITVNAALSWMQNQGIALAYVGAAPDIGAHEYGSQPAPVKK